MLIDRMGKNNVQPISNPVPVSLSLSRVGRRGSAGVPLHPRNAPLPMQPTDPEAGPDDQRRQPAGTLLLSELLEPAGLLPLLHPMAQDTAYI